MDYNYTNLDEFLKDFYNKKLGFPYLNQKFNKKQILNVFNNIKKFNHQKYICKKKYFIKSIKLPNNIFNFLGNPYIFDFTKVDYYQNDIITTYFQEECINQCKIMNNPTPYDFYMKNIKKIAEYALKNFNEINIITLADSLWKVSKVRIICSTFRPYVLTFLIKIFNSKSVLDFSAGWGDRLVACMAMNVKYFGVDPNPCLHKGYKEMIDFFGKSNKDYIVKENTIENIELPIDKNFDLIFTSPPYFDLEIYAKNNKQSSKYNNENIWFNNFLKVALNKCWKVLIKGGYMAININQKNKENYVEKMINFINSEFKDSLFLGIISYTLKNPQPIFIWKKI
jgi:16S rRNA G966 N2-methylase RsmD